MRLRALRTALFGHAAAVLVAGAAALVLWGCTIGGTSGVGAENDRLRRENHELKDRVAALEAERDGAKAAAAQAGRAASIPSEVAEFLPRVAGVEIGRFSGLTPVSAAEPATGLVVYVEPYDGLRRFVQATGELSVSATLMPPADAEGGPVDLGRRTLGAKELSDAYRSGITGTHYRVEMPLAAAIRARRGTLAIQVELKDALTGEAYSATKTVELSD